jgi:hypothetical protein
MSHPALDAARRAVRDARLIGLEDKDARALVRVEVNFNTVEELLALLSYYTPFNMPDFYEQKGPLKFEDISIYIVERLPVPWKVYGLGITSINRITATVTEAPPPATD